MSIDDDRRHYKVYPDCLTRRDVANRWNCCPHTVARRPDLTPIRFNRRLLRYRLEDVQAIEAAGHGGLMS